MSNLSFSEVKEVTSLVNDLCLYRGEEDVRGMILERITKLLRAEYASSYTWNNKKKRFDNSVSLNISERLTKEYEEYYQYHDPITFEMRRRGCSIVSEIMPYKHFYMTDFYNGAVRADGMRYGINLYLFDGNKDIGDFRLWRCEKEGDFEQRDKEILKILEPYLKQSVLNYEQKNLIHKSLTKREKEVAFLVSKGLTDREIAGYLNIGFSTVRTHLNHSLEKLNCSNRAELATLLASA